jgi:hypothetical protein
MFYYIVSYAYQMFYVNVMYDGKFRPKFHIREGLQWIDKTENKFFSDFLL